MAVLPSEAGGVGPLPGASEGAEGSLEASGVVPDEDCEEVPFVMVELEAAAAAAAAAAAFTLPERLVLWLVLTASSAVPVDSVDPLLDPPPPCLAAPAPPPPLPAP